NQKGPGGMPGPFCCAAFFSLPPLGEEERKDLGPKPPCRLAAVGRTAVLPTAAKRFGPEVLREDTAHLLALLNSFTRSATPGLLKLGTSSAARATGVSRIATPRTARPLYRFFIAAIPPHRWEKRNF